MNLSWQAEVWAQMRDSDIRRSDLANAAGVTPEYVSMGLNQKRTPAGAEARFRSALQKLINAKENSND